MIDGGALLALEVEGHKSVRCDLEGWLVVRLLVRRTVPEVFFEEET